MKLPLEFPRYGFIRVDTTFVHDAHAFYEDDTGGGGGLRVNTNNPLALRDFPDNGAVITNPPFLNAVNNPYINLVRNPNTPFIGSASINVIYADHFTNDGGGGTWLPFDIDSDGENTDQHRIITMVERSEYKRQQAAPGLKISEKAFGVGRRFPIAAKNEV